MSNRYAFAFISGALCSLLFLATAYLDGGTRPTTNFVVFIDILSAATMFAAFAWSSISPDWQHAFRSDDFSNERFIGMARITTRGILFAAGFFTTASALKLILNIYL